MNNINDKLTDQITIIIETMVATSYNKMTVE